MAKVVIAGASGFVGSALIQYFLDNTQHEIVALSRREQTSHHKRLNWVQCDLFSLLDIEQALEGCDYAYYLVHSMLPSARLTQGKFEDFDLLLADNFARAAQKKSLEHIIYLGGVIPQVRNLSLHLKSRLEVEQNLKASGVPITSIRAGIIIGAQGSSFTLMRRLVEKLPLMLCPAWTQSESSPVSLNDVVISLAYCLGEQEHFDKIYDLSCGENISYQNLMDRLAKKLGLSRKFYSISNFSPKLSRLWVSFITKAPKNLVAPLVESLKTSMKPNPDLKLVIPGHTPRSYEQMIEDALESQEAKTLSPRAFAYTGHNKEASLVRSLQRFTLVPIQSAREIASRYFGWLPYFFSPLIKVQQSGDQVFFRTLNLKKPLLVLEYSGSRSSLDRQLFYIIGGVLVKKTRRGRLEFRHTLTRKHVICAIHDFKPSLPWYVYKYTQAIVHLIVMLQFAKYLKKNFTFN